LQKYFTEVLLMMTWDEGTGLSDSFACNT